MKINLLLIICPEAIMYFGPNKFNRSVGSTRMKPMKRIFTYIVETTSIALIVMQALLNSDLELNFILIISFS